MNRQVIKDNMWYYVDKIIKMDYNERYAKDHLRIQIKDQLFRSWSQVSGEIHLVLWSMDINTLVQSTFSKIRIEYGYDTTKGK